MKKRVLSILLVALMVMGLCTAAFAADGDTYIDKQGAKFTVKYTATNGTAPTETFTFTDFTCTSVTDAAEGVTTANAPIPTKIADVELASGASKEVEIALPTYTSVGVYTYTFNQAVGTTAGVTYYNDDAVQTMKLVVSVLQDTDGYIRVAAVHVENGSTDDDKTEEIENTYDSGELTVDKVVTGNMGDKTKEFEVTVTFTPASGETIKSDIAYTGAVSGTVANNTVTFNLKHGQNVKFTNIPEGVTWKVEEADYTSDGYDAADYSTQTASMTAGGEATCTITNNKDTTVDTGITMDTIPYIMIALFACLAAAVVVIRKRRIAE